MQMSRIDFTRPSTLSKYMKSDSTIQIYSSNFCFLPLYNATLCYSVLHAERMTTLGSLYLSLNPRLPISLPEPEYYLPHAPIPTTETTEWRLPDPPTTRNQWAPVPRGSPPPRTWRPGWPLASQELWHK